MGRLRENSNGSTPRFAGGRNCARVVVLGKAQEEGRRHSSRRAHQRMSKMDQPGLEQGGEGSQREGKVAEGKAR